MPMQTLVRVNPLPIQGIQLSSFNDAIDLIKWCRADPAVTGHLSDKADGTFEVRVESQNSSVTVPQGNYFVVDSGLYYSLTPTEATTTYKPAP